MIDLDASATVAVEALLNQLDRLKVDRANSLVEFERLRLMVHNEHRAGRVGTEDLRRLHLIESDIAKIDAEAAHLLTQCAVIVEEEAARAISAIEQIRQ